MARGLLSRFAAMTVVVVCVFGAVVGQSPNTANVVVTVVDQNGAVVRGANVSIVNTATAASREATAGDEGTATFAGLPAASLAVPKARLMPTWPSPVTLLSVTVRSKPLPVTVMPVALALPVLAKVISDAARVTGPICLSL